MTTSQERTNCTCSITTLERLINCQICCHKENYAVREFISECETNPDCLINLFRLKRIQDKNLPEISFNKNKRQNTSELNFPKQAKYEKTVDHNKEKLKPNEEKVVTYFKEKKDNLSDSKKYHYLMVDKETSNEKFEDIPSTFPPKIESNETLIAFSIASSFSNSGSEVMTDIAKFYERKLTSIDDYNDDDVNEQNLHDKPEEEIERKSIEPKIQRRNRPKEQKNPKSLSKSEIRWQKSELYVGNGKETRQIEKKKKIGWLERISLGNSILRGRPSTTSSASSALYLLRQVAEKDYIPTDTKDKDKGTKYKDKKTKQQQKPIFRWLPCLKMFRKKKQEKKGNDEIDVYPTTPTSDLTLEISL